MIKKFIEKLLGKSGPAAARRRSARGKRVEVPKSEHGIDPTLVDERAVKVVSTLADAGFEAYIVGGAVRDLLLGLRPKDFDVATNATPEQVKALFRRAFIIGRRFRIVHVVFGRGRQDRGLTEVIEVSTFRALGRRRGRRSQVEGNEKTCEGGHGRQEPCGRRQRPGAARQRLGPADRGRRAARLHRSTRCTTTRCARSSSTTTAASRTRRRSCCA